MDSGVWSTFKIFYYCKIVLSRRREVKHFQCGVSYVVILSRDDYSGILHFHKPLNAQTVVVVQLLSRV